MAATGVVVVGAGVSGTACARELDAAGVPVRLLDRGRAPGGRMASRRLPVPGADGVRPVDIGASYFTASGEEFGAVVAGWRARGLAREWARSFHVVTGTARAGARLGGPTEPGPVRWAAPGGLRSLVADLQDGLDVRLAHDVEAVDAASGSPQVDGEPAAAVVLAMPDPQAGDLLPADVAQRLDVSGRWDWRPCIAVAAGWAQRWWPPLDGAFVNDSDVLTFLADDGARRGDGAPVLVAHTAPELSAAALDDPPAVVPTVLAELEALLSDGPVGEPEWVRAHRWSLAQPLRQHADSPFGWDEASGIGVCGDAWGPVSRVEGAYLSGRALGRHLAQRLG
ncbi:NAD(P)/FAD-dependent oxidoreductase [Kineococcus glutinatus]|uniref:NAD(P)-binding protein n=1 Tax=Kineococcus glutinatus TaxID=1070872 RepID=A0ABP9HI19_9ACTN